MTHTIETKRIYDPISADEGLRVLVDRLWPRGVSKSKAALDLWLKDVAPSTELRTWFAHRLDRWDEFRERYLLELQKSVAVEELRTLAHAGPVTLLYGARDRSHNEAVVLAAFLRDSTP